MSEEMPAAADGLERRAHELLGQQATQMAALRRDLDRLAHETADALIVVHDRLDDTNTPNGHFGTVDPLARWCWRDLDDQAAARMMSQLAAWVDWLRSRSIAVGRPHPIFVMSGQPRFSPVVQPRTARYSTS